ncbi:hypothetical protein KCV01_g19969, partial [Aureobasidium melanogenum]
MAAVRRYIAAIAPRVRPLLAKNGGPVLMIQVENEYSMQGDDVAYLKDIEDIWRQNGVDGPFSVSDGWKDLLRRKAYLPGAALGLDGAEVPILEQGRSFAHEAPVWVGEGYPGWLTHWGEPEFASRDYVDTLRSVMKAGYSFNLYVVHGGTNFGLTAGSNAEDDGSQFQPVITSYDYGAPIDETGQPTAQYHRLRDMIAQVTGRKPPELPASPPTTAFAETTLEPFASLWDNLPAAVNVPHPVSNEILFGQDQGLVLWRKTIPSGATLTLDGARDYAVVHVDGREAGVVSRVEHPTVSSKTALTLPDASHEGRTLEILVDTFGHINFGPRVGDHKGLTGPVSLDGKALDGFEAWPLPLDGPWMTRLRPFDVAPTRGGVFFKGNLHIDQPGDVYVDMADWDKGYLWINGRLLGRYWRIGPQQRLYCPGPWLKAGDNEQRSTPPRAIGLWGGLSANVLNMIGIGPFVTIPLALSALAGPSVFIGWIAGALLCLCDGMVWAELGSTIPESGGPYHYLREAYGRERMGRLFGFLYLWQTLLTAPLSIGSAAVGFAQYFGYLVPSLGETGRVVVAASLCLVNTAVLYRKVGDIQRLSLGITVIVAIACVWIVGSGIAHFDTATAEHFLHARNDDSHGFWLGLGAVALIAVYDYGGYNNVCMLGGEVRNPRRTIPLAVLLSIPLVALLYLGLNLSILGVLPWEQAAHSKAVVADFMQAIHGNTGGT